MDYKDEMNARRSLFDDMVSEFILEYPQLVQIARSSMGSLYNAEDYPSAEGVQDKFGFRLVFSPVPEAGDFRLDIPQQDLADMRADYDIAFNDRLADAMHMPWTKLHDMLTNMSAKLTGSDEDTQKRWHDTFLTNGYDLCAMLSHLNITKDPHLESARRQLETALLNTNIEAIKSDDAERDNLKTKLDAILQGYEW